MIYPFYRPTTFSNNVEFLLSPVPPMHSFYGIVQIVEDSANTIYTFKIYSSKVNKHSLKIHPRLFKYYSVTFP
uniref:Uncharacterized protein n=1 Tax=Octopus bimaculoides TaxID=37653 RepID=A0A0L8FG99_OCTBM